MSVKRRYFWNRKYIINPRFQWNFVISMFLLSLLIVALLYITNYYLIWKIFSNSNIATAVSAETYEKIMSQQYSVMNHFFLLTTIVTSIILIFSGILISHKIAGPMFRLKRHMLNVARGEDISLIKFRNNDHFHDMAKAYNEQLIYLHRVKIKNSILTNISNSGPKS